MNILSNRNPSLYKPSWNCFHCNLVAESHSQLWFCQPTDPTKWSRLKAFQMIIDLAKESLKKHLLKDLKKCSFLPAPDWLNIFANLQCWDLSTMTSQLNSFDLLKGFVPQELSNFVLSILGNRSSTEKLINKILFKIQDRAYKFIWIS